MNPFVSDGDMLKLRLNLFKHSKASLVQNNWDLEQDELLKIQIKLLLKF